MFRELRQGCRTACASLLPILSATLSDAATSGRRDPPVAAAPLPTFPATLADAATSDKRDPPVAAASDYPAYWLQCSAQAYAPLAPFDGLTVRLLTFTFSFR